MQEIAKRCIHKLGHMKIHHHFATVKDKKKHFGKIIHDDKRE